jgi:hypothetical protein
MTLTEQQFIALLNTGLWGHDIDTNLFQESTDWEVLYRISKEQTSLGIVYDAIEHLPVELRPDRQMIFKWYAQIRKIEQLNRDLSEMLVSVYNLYCAQGFHPVLLKGQGVASFYPNPLHRQCGDIDLLVGQHDYDAVNQFVKEHLSISKTLSSDKHFHFDYNNHTVENHRYAAMLLPSSRNKVFQQYTDAWYTDSDHLSTLCDTFRIGENKILMPPPAYNIIFSLVHIFNHFISGGLGIRQLCDLSILVDHYRDQVDWQQIQNKLQELKLIDVWRVFISFCVDYLGLSPRNLPLCDDHTRTASVAEYLFAYGNFGHFHTLQVTRPKGYWRNKLRSLHMHFIQFRDTYRILPEEAVRVLLQVLPNGISQIRRDKQQNHGT